jgi:hypothetical protein
LQHLETFVSGYRKPQHLCVAGLRFAVTVATERFSHDTLTTVLPMLAALQKR